jgi:metal-dependent amidase/aminoacylase/carboxypeptidase family protein
MGTDMFEITVDGGGGHAGLAHEARDVVLAAAHLMTALQTITARETSPLGCLGLTALRERALARIDQISRATCAALNVSHQIELTATVPVLRCAADPIASLAGAAAAAAAPCHRNRRRWTGAAAPITRPTSASTNERSA